MQSEKQLETQSEIDWLNPKNYSLEGTGDLSGLESLMNDSVLRGGKRLRPILMADFARLFGIAPDRILVFARAAERIHSATLAHDDVVDASDRRRGIPTLNSRIENRRAVLGGDYLLAEGIFEVAAQGNLAIVASLSETLKELVTGELLQNEARGVVAISAEHLHRVADLKTGSLFRWCCVVPAILAGSGPETIRATRDFATRLGVAFQWVDDALDYSENSGKPFAQDLREGLVNEVSRRLVESEPGWSKRFGRFFSGKDPFDSLSLSPAIVADAVRETRGLALAELGAARRILADLILHRKREGVSTDVAAIARIERILERLEGRKK